MITTQGNSGQKIPPKLQALLEVIPDIDKVNLLHIARHYQMDLDDPGFLPLLLTQQGIAALEAARSELEKECSASVTFALSRASAAIGEAGKAQQDRIISITQEAEQHLSMCAADTEIALQEAVAIWSERTLSDSIANALMENSEAAKSTALLAANSFAEVANHAASTASDAARDCKKAAEAATEAVKDTKILFVLCVFLLGVIAGSGAIYFSAKPKASDVYLDTAMIAKTAVNSCIKK